MPAFSVVRVYKVTLSDPVTHWGQDRIAEAAEVASYRADVGNLEGVLRLATIDINGEPAEWVDLKDYPSALYCDEITYRAEEIDVITEPT